MTRLETLFARHGIAFLALFIALSGTATAATLINGNNIKKGTVTSEQVKNRSLLAKDFKRGQLPKGNTGATGATGAAGAAGASGAAAAKGDTGAAGTDGADGAKGDTGETGAKGEKGDTGASGTDGTNGTDGTKGDKGDTGAPGTDGTNGTNGTNGADGAKGEPGENGDKGDKGDKGDAGTDGTNGVKGDTGAKGDPGENGTGAPLSYTATGATGGVVLVTLPGLTSGSYTIQAQATATGFGSCIVRTDYPRDVISRAYGQATGGRKFTVGMLLSTTLSAGEKLIVQCEESAYLQEWTVIATRVTAG